MLYKFFSFDKEIDQNYKTRATKLLWCDFLITKYEEQPFHLNLLSETRKDFVFTQQNQEIVITWAFFEIQSK